MKNANFEVLSGEIHALLGANGAGKSTLVKILTGVISGNSGSISLNGKPVGFSSPDDARKNGIAPVFQDPALIPDLSIQRNLALTGTDEKRFITELSAMGLNVNLNEVAVNIELPLLRMIDLARALSHDPELLILDEITAALPVDLAEKVISIMNSQKNKGKSVIFISHRLAEIEEICDRATVLRDGINVDTFAASRGSEERIVAAMLGDKNKVSNKLSDSKKIDRSNSVFLEAKSISAGKYLKDLSFQIRKGEVLGVAALEGQGQDLLFEILAGESKLETGEIFVNNKKVTLNHPRDAISMGISYVPGDRKSALMPQRSIRENLALTRFRGISKWGMINTKSEENQVDDAISSLQIDTRAKSQVKRLSGGNQQKVTIGRWVTTGFDLLLCFDPTRGIDVGTKQQIYDLIRKFADQGKSVLLFTSELREIQMVCDRAIVIYEGKVQADLSIDLCSEENLMNAAHGILVAK
ncbi:MAG: sugar ABC transporter ATP-binding protein [Actinomycetota bacterium]|nr:sugar ABC transporter ATP-binding protein [Actinomycetota bacterium]